MKKDILIKKNKFFLFGLFLFALYSCQNNTKNQISKPDLIKFLNNTYGEFELHRMYKLINDSINVWRQMKLEGYNYYPCVNVKLDPLICFNKEKNKLLAIKLRQTNCENPYDGYTYFYGVKVKDMWLFFDDEYQGIAKINNNTPATFEQLSKIAFDDVFQYYLKRNEKGELEIDESIFSSLTDNGWAEGDEGIMPKTKEEWDQRYIREAAERRARIDTNDYSKME
jgi:hypothetical protein